MRDFVRITYEYIYALMHRRLHSVETISNVEKVHWWSRACVFKTCTVPAVDVVGSSSDLHRVYRHIGVRVYRCSLLTPLRVPLRTHKEDT